jgi:hypothetical protein
MNDAQVKDKGKSGTMVRSVTDESVGTVPELL